MSSQVETCKHLGSPFYLKGMVNKVWSAHGNKEGAEEAANVEKQELKENDRKNVSWT